MFRTRPRKHKELLTDMLPPCAALSAQLNTYAQTPNLFALAIACTKTSELATLLLKTKANSLYILSSDHVSDCILG
jgi:hypothetical protein